MTRNGRIAKVMQDLNWAETKGTGIRTMREEMRKANLSTPLFESDRTSNSFALTLLTHHFFDPEDIKWLANFEVCNLSDEEARTLIVVREMGAITNADYRNINSVDTLSASSHLRRLRDLGLLEQKGNGSATYYIPTKKLCAPNATPQISPIIGELDGLPEDIKNDVRYLKKRASSAKIRSIIARICSIKYFKLGDIAFLLGRGPEYTRARFLSPMTDEGELELLYPHQPNHPYQAYRTKKRRK